jgi:hypothetical protein
MNNEGSGYIDKKDSTNSIRCRSKKRLGQATAPIGMLRLSISLGLSACGYILGDLLKENPWRSHKV